MNVLKVSKFLLVLMLGFSFLKADEEELIEGSKHIISLDLEARFELSGSGNEISPRDSGSGSGFDFKYQYLFGLGININAEHAAPLFMYIQRPSFIGADVSINSDKFEGQSTREGSPFRVDSSSNVYDLRIFGQNYFKNGFGITYKLRDSIIEGARFQIYDDATVGDTGLEKLDQNEILLDLGLNKYLASGRLLLGLDLGFSAISGEKPFVTGKRDDANDISGNSFNAGFRLDYLTSKEKWMFGFTYNFLSMDLDTDVTLNQGGRVTTSTADFQYSVNRDETVHFIEFRFKHIYKNSLAFNYKFSYRQTHDDLDSELASSGPTVEGRDIDEYRFTFSPEFWIFNRMKVAVSTGVASYSLSEDGGEPINVGGVIREASTREFDYLTWFIGMNVDILF